LPDELPANHEEAMAFFDAEHRVLLAALHRSASDGHDTETWQLAWALDTYQHRHGHREDQVAAWQAALAAADRLGHLGARAYAHRFLARALFRQQRLADAVVHLEQSLHLHRQAGDPTGLGHVHHELAVVWDPMGDIHKSFEHDQQALCFYWAAGHRRGQAVALNGVGWSCIQFGQPERALRYCTAALTRFRRLGDGPARP
jgi:tetratricopeptide (TPR) repeat protein